MRERRECVSARLRRTITFMGCAMPQVIRKCLCVSSGGIEGGKLVGARLCI